jgi:hypothetical protein
MSQDLFRPAPKVSSLRVLRATSAYSGSVSIPETDTAPFGVGNDDQLVTLRTLQERARSIADAAPHVGRLELVRQVHTELTSTSRE